jgi:hypothetical protein
MNTLNIPSVPAVKVNEEKKMANKFIGKKATKEVDFLGEKILIKKLSINQVIQVQDLTKSIEDSNDDKGGIKILLFVIKQGVEEFSTYEDSDLMDCPMEDLALLSNTIMEFSGLLPKDQSLKG